MEIDFWIVLYIYYMIRSFCHGLRTMVNERQASYEKDMQEI